MDALRVRLQRAMVGAMAGANWRDVAWWRAVVALAAAGWILRFLLDPSTILASWMHGPVLVIHEAGHVLLPFGRFGTILGGTLLQVALPLAFVAWFALSRQPFAAALTLLWVAFSLADGAVYVADARERLLPLITFDASTHDWWNLLRMLGLLEQDDLLAGLFRFQAWLAWAAGLLWALGSALPAAAPPDRDVAM